MSSATIRRTLWAACMALSCRRSTSLELPPVSSLASPRGRASARCSVITLRSTRAPTAVAGLVRRTHMRCLLCILGVGFLSAAVIEVTEGGGVHDATYKFSDSVGSEMATLKGNSSAVTCSTDVVTGSGNSVDALANMVNDLATRLSAAEATISTMQTALAAKLDSSVAASTYLTQTTAASSYLTSASAAGIYPSETELFNILAKQHLSGRCHFANSKHTCYQGCSGCNFCSNRGSQTLFNCAKLCAMTENCRSFDYSGSTCMLVNHPNKPNDRGSSPTAGVPAT